MIIGNFIYDSEADTFAGALTTLTVTRNDIRIKPADPKNDKEPDYRIVSETVSGPVEFGAAWKRTSERGQAFLSVSLDDPSLNAPINCALFRDEGSDTATLVWNRAKGKPADITTGSNAKAKKAKAA